VNVKIFLKLLWIVIIPLNLNKNNDSSSLSFLSQIALVEWTESVGLTLTHRDLNEIHLRSPLGDILKYKVLQVFPFTSETKRMGIIVKV